MLEKSCVRILSALLAQTKDKIARVSGAKLGLPHGSLTLKIEGTPEQRRRALKYCKCVMAQRVGPVRIDESSDDGDLTIVDVPQVIACVMNIAPPSMFEQIANHHSTSYEMHPRVV